MLQLCNIEKTISFLFENNQVKLNFRHKEQYTCIIVYTDNSKA